jgi:hypothetical protein
MNDTAREHECPNWDRLHDEFKRLRQQTDRLLEGQQKLLTMIAAKEEVCKSCVGKVEGLELVVYGNGDPGLKGKVASLLETRTNMRWGFGLVWSGVVAIGAALTKVWYGK